MTLDVTLSDFFCGAGGSSTGALKALRGQGRIVMAANHWARAIETHQINHPTVEHDLADLQATLPSRYPRTTICWMSPECTNHSVAKGRRRKGINQLDLWGENGVDPAEERSRATMREVVEFTEYHRYEIVIVENVIDIRKWAHYDEWLTDILNLGYRHKVLYLNAMFFGVPQSRDRIYVVFWKKGNRAPNLDFRPPALCAEHGLVSAVQVWKKPEYEWGRYGKHGQYLYRCPTCGGVVEPFYVPAAAVIDWSIPSPRIGDRDKPLKPKTIARIKAGLKKFARPIVVDSAYSNTDDASKARPVDAPLATQTTRQTLALAEPFLASQHEGRDAVRSVGRELPCITTFNNEHALVCPPFLAVLKNSYSADGKYTLPPRSLDEPLTTVVASGSQHALITPFIAEMHGASNARSTDDPLMCILAGAQHHGLVTPFVIETGGAPERKETSVESPLPTMLTRQSMSLITPFLTSVNYYDEILRRVTEVLPTQTTASKLALTTPAAEAIDIDPDALIDDCGFRMLEPEELKLGMSFPAEYVITGNKREQVKQVGDAVACNVAEWIVGRCVESLT